MSEKIVDELRKRLKAKNIHDLRQIARAAGVKRPADGKKDRLIDGIMVIATGESDPSAPSVRGAHPKSSEYDRQLVADIFRCREVCLAAAGKTETCEMLTVASGVEYDALDFNAEGFVEQTDGKWFMHINGCCDNILSQVYVSDYYVGTFGLREGDLISGRCKRNSPDELAGLTDIKSVNRSLPQTLSNRLNFDSLAPVYPDRRLKTERGQNDYTGRLTDLLSPVGAGQRAFVIGPHGCGKTSVLKDLAKGIMHNNQSAVIIFLLIDSRPEEAGEFNSVFGGTYIFSSPFDASAFNHVHTAKLALEFSKRLTESGKDVVLFVDDLTRLTRAYNDIGRHISPTFDISAVESVKKFLAAARNTRSGASLTIISALSDGSGGQIDDAVYSGLKDLANMRITLSPGCARMRIYPPVDVENTHASGDERLLSDSQLKTAVKLRGEDLQKIFSLFAQTKNNDELCEMLLR